MVKAKKLGGRERNQDYVRAMCFVQLEQYGDARETLLEELRHYPDNKDARALLDEVLKQDGAQVWLRGGRTRAGI